MVGRAAYTRLTIPDEGKQAIATAWRDRLLDAVVMPELPAAEQEVA
jgi:hypothetical protein